MSIDRREFLKFSWLTALLVFSWCVNSSKINVEEVLENHLALKDKNHIKNIKDEMSLYLKNYSRGIKPDLRRFKNITDKNLYWSNPNWTILAKNQVWTFVNKNLVWNVAETIEEKRPIIIVEDLNWKKILRFYINWNLEVATYVSPWTLSNRTSTRLFTNRWKIDKYHTSWNKDRKWAVMPYAIWVVWWIWLHWSDWIVNWSPRSHWCIRVPLFFQKRIYDLVEEHTNNDLIIDTRNLY